MVSATAGDRSQNPEISKTRQGIFTICCSGGQAGKGGLWGNIRLLIFRRGPLLSKRTGVCGAQLPASRRVGSTPFPPRCIVFSSPSGLGHFGHFVLSLWLIFPKSRADYKATPPLPCAQETPAILLLDVSYSAAGKMCFSGRVVFSSVFVLKLRALLAHGVSSGKRSLIQPCWTK